MSTYNQAQSDLNNNIDEVTQQYPSLFFSAVKYDRATDGYYIELGFSSNIPPHINLLGDTKVVVHASSDVLLKEEVEKKMEPKPEPQQKEKVDDQVESSTVVLVQE